MTAAVAEAVSALRAATVWDGDRLATLRWWTDRGLLAALGPGLAGLFPDAAVTIIAGVQSSGYLLAPLVSVHCGVGMLGIQKLPQSDGAICLASASETLSQRDCVLLVDDVVETGQQAAAVRDLVISRNATWLGIAAMVKYVDRPDLGLRSLIDIDQL